MRAAAGKEWEVTRVHNHTKTGVGRMPDEGKSSSNGGDVVENHKKRVAAAAAAVTAMVDMPAQGSTSRGEGNQEEQGWDGWRLQDAQVIGSGRGRGKRLALSGMTRER